MSLWQARFFTRHHANHFLVSTIHSFVSTIHLSPCTRITSLWCQVIYLPHHTNSKTIKPFVKAMELSTHVFFLFWVETIKHRILFQVYICLLLIIVQILSIEDVWKNLLHNAFNDEKLLLDKTFSSLQGSRLLSVEYLSEFFNQPLPILRWCKQ